MLPWKITSKSRMSNPDYPETGLDSLARSLARFFCCAQVTLFDFWRKAICKVQMAFSHLEKGGSQLTGAFEIVMAERKALVDKIINTMKQGNFFHNASEWDRAALRPQNPLSKVWYRRGTRMKLMAIVTEKGYRDPR